ncbi:zinc metalloprotease ProA [Legionella septentrionalis]|uniref:Neutral metalloproteinase n=2 Tax=Legionella TaxID=445 RepID=A0A433JM90_9GAMM|nr:M4 family metallopeptidase [Legionella septentrionalis]RUQ90793.1 peptidase M4 family protein [Legionella septentrionalis]
MHRNFYLSPLAISIAIALSSPVKAAEPIPLENASFSTIQQNFQLVMPNTLQAGINNKNTLKVIQQRTDENHVNHIRMQQQYQGFPVYRGYAIIHSKQSPQLLSSANQQASMNGTVFTGLEAELGQPSAGFLANANSALQHFKAQYANYALSEEQVVPMVFVDENQRAFWAYKVSVFVQYPDKIPERRTAIIDAQTYKPFLQWNDVKTGRGHIQGAGFGGNQRVHKYQYGQDLPHLWLSRDNATQICYMANRGVKIVDMHHKYNAPNKPMQFSCKLPDAKNPKVFWTGYKGDGYDKQNGAYSPTNDALYAGTVINQMYYKWYGVYPLVTKMGKPMQLVMRVHYGEGYENAFWDGKQMTFGDGDTMMYPLVSLGVSSHEISHGFTEQHSDLMYFGQSGGMNEAFSDMAAQAAEFYSTKKNTWMIGAEIMKENSGYDALRYMDKPSRDGYSIDNADEYYDGLDVHFSSGVYNRLFYVLAHQNGWDTRKAFSVMVKANMDYWTPFSNFQEGGCGIIQAAKDLKLDEVAVKQSLSEVALKPEQCKELSPVV